MPHDDEDDDDLVRNFVSGDPALDLSRACYAVSDSLAYDKETSFLCFKLKTIVSIRGVKHFDAQKFGAALFGSFRRPDIESEMANLQFDEKQIAVVPAESRETGISPSDAVMEKIPALIRRGLEKLGLCLDVVPRRPSIDQMFDNDFTGELH